VIEMKLDQERTYVYRLWDNDKNLLYVGVSNNWANRINQHKQQKQWSGQISSVTVEEFASRYEALAAESKAIQTENPIYNLAGRTTATGDPSLVIDKSSRLDESYSVHQASVMIGVSDRRVRQLVAKGRLVVAHLSPMRLDAKSVHDMRELRKRGHVQASTPPAMGIELATLAAETARVTWETVGKQDFERLILELRSAKVELNETRSDFAAQIQGLMIEIKLAMESNKFKSTKKKWQRRDQVA